MIDNVNDLKGPQCVETSRLHLRRPNSSGAAKILRRYAGDPDVTKFVGWPTHRSIKDTIAFLSFSDAEWALEKCGFWRDSTQERLVLFPNLEPPVVQLSLRYVRTFGNSDDSSPSVD